MSVSVGLFVRLEAMEGMEEQLASFLESAQPLAEDEPDTTAWFAVRFGYSTFGIFDVFPDDSGRQAHLNGPIAAALMENAPRLLAEPPKIEQIDVLASKLPG